MSGADIGYDPTDPQGLDDAREEAGKRARADQETEESDIRWLMTCEQGRRIVWRLLSKSGVFQSSFDPMAMQMAFNEGKRNYGLYMLELVHTSCPELYRPMMKEHVDGRPDKRCDKQ
jgi:hypothetical protein